MITKPINEISNPFRFMTQEQFEAFASEMHDLADRFTSAGGTGLFAISKSLKDTEFEISCMGNHKDMAWLAMNMSGIVTRELMINNDFEQ